MLVALSAPLRLVQVSGVEIGCIRSSESAVA
jgi:hypothetical protein